VKRRLLKFLTLLSLLPCVAAAVSWPVSFAGTGRGLSEPPPHAAGVEQSRGRLRFVIPLGRLDVDVRELFPRGGGSLRSGETVHIRLADRQARLRDVELLEFRRGGTVRAASMEEWSDGGSVASGRFTVAVSEESRYGPILVGSGTAVTYSRTGVSGPSSGQSLPFRTVSVPYWVFVALSGAPPAFWLAKAADQRRRRAAGMCRVCGYDLRATPDACPECGTIPSSRRAG
jgi:hypothetical protein